MSLFSSLVTRIEDAVCETYYGKVAAGLGIMIEAEGLERVLCVGDRCRVVSRDGRRILCETVGFREGRALLMPYGRLEGVGQGCVVEADGIPLRISPDRSWLGRVVDAFGVPVDSKGPLSSGGDRRGFQADPPSAYERRPVGVRLQTGVRALDCFVPLCTGQRMGIFAGSGVGKSTLMGMLARYSNADVIVIGLIGERGREVQEFITKELGDAGLARSVMIVATSDESPLMRRQAAYTTMTVAEAFRDQGLHVLCLMDSVTRFAMAQREIGLAAGEPPTAKGYPPTVFAEMPRLLERSGPGSPVRGQGDITAVFTVLVDGDDHDEPIADAVRGILDGHIVLNRKIGERGRYPAIDILRSVSRTLPDCHSDEENRLIVMARRMLARFEDMQELIRIGAYKAGSDEETDFAIAIYPEIESFLRQAKHEKSNEGESFRLLSEVIAQLDALTSP